MVTRADVWRLDYGYFARSAEETGTGQPRLVPVAGYLVRHPRGLVLFDTGVAEDPRIDEQLPVVRRPLAGALATAGVTPADVDYVVNCHLHFDHCGGNPTFAGTPIVAQAGEFTALDEIPYYTIPELVDFAGATYERIDGELELLPDLWVIPTPGHTDGHQSLVVRCTDGTVVLAGQSHETAADYTFDALAAAAARTNAPVPTPPYPKWIDRLAEFDPARVLFAHDLSVWEPP